MLTKTRWSIAGIILTVSRLSRIQGNDFLALSPKRWWNGVVVAIHLGVIGRLRNILAWFQRCRVKRDVALVTVGDLYDITINQIALQLLMESIWLLLIHNIDSFSLELLVLTLSEIRKL